MPTRLVQISDGASRRVALVDEPYLRCVEMHGSTYDIARHCARSAASIQQYARSLANGESISYDEVYEGRSAWRLMSPIDVPGQPSRLLVSGTGLTHVGSARQRQAMHLAAQAKEASDPMTDSMRMFQLGIEQGRPPEGTIGVAPEWFYKGDGAVLRAPFEPLEIPGHAEDGGEEAELAGVYLVDESGTPWRIGFAQGNEFSDHKFEKRNYLNLAGSKLRTCSIGPELVVGAEFADVSGQVQIVRDGTVLWEKNVVSGEQNMCHSLANLEHHHFKFDGHRQPGSLHVHFFGADALSFGDAVQLKDRDIVIVQFDGFGRPLRNPIHEGAKMEKPIRIGSLA